MISTACPRVPNQKTMKTRILITGAFTLACLQAGAATTVTLTGLDTNSQFNVNGANFTGHAASLGVTSGTQTFSVTGLVIDGFTIDVDFSYLVTSTGGNVANVSGNAFSYGVDGDADPNDNEIDPGESLTFVGLSASTTTPGVTLTVDSAGFTGFNWRYSGGDDGETVDAEYTGGTETAVGSGLYTNTGGANDRANFTSAQESFTITGATTGNGFGVDTLAATFVLTAVPEPSAFALLTLGSLGFLVRRRR